MRANQGKVKPVLRPAERQIIKVLLEHDYYLTTREIANMSHVHWNTARNNLEKFHKKKWVRKDERGGLEVWKVILRGR